MTGAPALFTRDTLILMRREAYRGIQGVAQLLNWSNERTARVGKAHGVEFGLMPGLAAVIIAAVDPPTPPPPAARSRRSGPLRALTREERAAIIFSPTGHVVRFSGAEVKLSEAQWLVLRALHRDSDHVRAADICIRTGTAQNSIGAHIAILRDRLRPLGLHISNGVGQGGGYSLVIFDEAAS